MQVQCAPQTPLEQRAWNACSGPGVWRWHHGEEKDGDKWKGKRWPEGLIVSEALTRCAPASAAERDALLELFDAIERGAVTGAHDGLETAEDREREGD